MKLMYVGAALMVLQVGSFVQAQESISHDSFYWLTEINKASIVMLVEQGIVPKQLGRTIAQAVAQVSRDAEKPGAARPGDYLQVEKLLMAVGGPDISRIHSGRSRQDIGATTRRLFQREQLLEAFMRMNKARGVLLDMAGQNAEAVIPAYTWGVQAQPITLGHYLLAFTEALERDAERLRQAYARLNLSPLGAAALGTSSFPVNRPRLAELLGFDAAVENSYGANQVSPIDIGTELVSTAASSALTIGALVADVTAQYHQVEPWLVFAPEAVAGSSIMPQKRNPMPLIALRTQGSRLLGDAEQFIFLAHNVEPGMGDYKGSEPDSVLKEMGRLFDMLSTTVAQLRFDRDRAAAEVEVEYSTTTELADTLQRTADVPFRVGHHFASELVNFGRSRHLRPSEIPFEEARRIYSESARSSQWPQTELPLTEDIFRKSLSAANMVSASQGLGGPQPSEVVRMLARQRKQLQADRDWLDARRSQLVQASAALNAAFDKLLATPKN